MTRKIRWTWWRSPLGGKEWEDDAESPAPKRDRQFYDYDEDDLALPAVRPFAITPAGAVPLVAYGDITRNFNLWIGHANFQLEEGDDARIAEVDGVETLEVLTRYRFRAGFGLAFDDAGVRRAIEAALGAGDPPAATAEGDDPRTLRLDPRARSRMKGVMRKIRRRGWEFWAVFSGPDGEIKVDREHSAAGLAARVAYYQQVIREAGGVLFTSHD